MKSTKIVSTLVGALLLAAALAYGFWPEPKGGKKSSLARASVKVATIVPETTRREVRFSGVTRAARRAVLSFVVAARVTARPVEVGDRVAAGDVLAVLDVREFDNNLAVARATANELRVRLAQAERDRRRYARLISDKAIAVKEFEQTDANADALRSALEAAEARLQEASRTRSEAILKAPFGGTVTAVRLEPGEWATAGQPVVELSGDGRIELEIEVPETVVGRLAESDRVNVHLPFLDDHMVTGRVKTVTRAALASGRLFPVVVELDPEPMLAAGLTAELILTLRTEPQLMVPAVAIVNPGSSRPSLFVIEGGRVREVFVELGSFDGDRVAVSGNLAAGDQVVVSGHTSLTDGKPVEVRS
jgi:RND family efflux transporter MFP subunit